MKQPTPIYSITLDGKDLTTILAPRLVNLTLTETRGDEADTLDVTISDHDGAIEIPSRGAVLDVSIGWEETGLIHKGKFTVDEVEHSGAPDVLTLRARSASLTKGLGERREQSWHKNTIADIVKTIAKRAKLNPVIADAIGKIVIDHIDQTNESDMSFLTRLAKRYDAVMNVKDKNLLFMPIGTGKTASGRTLQVVKLTRRDGDQHRYNVRERESYEGVRAWYHNGRKSKKEDVIAGGEARNNLKVLPEVYANKADAQAAADAEYNRIKRGAATFGYTLALARPDLYPELHVTVSGFKPSIDSTPWLIKSISSSMGDTFTTTLDLETRDAAKTDV